MTTWSSGYVTDLGYTHGFYKELTPTLLSFVPLIKGLRSFDPEASLKICELGCGQGLSTNLLAAANPHMEFYATDFNPSQIVGAQALAQEADTPNVHFFDQSFAEFVDEPSLPSFDVIVLHGIYSWVQAERRAEIVEFIRRKLKAGGLVYISYNALPGWSAAAPMRHLMYMHGKSQVGPTATKLDPALAFIDRMIEAGGSFFNANPSLKERFDKLKVHDKSYLAHEYLNDAWALLYHSDVVRDMEPAKITYVGSGSISENMDFLNLSAAQQEIMKGFSDPVMRETIRDYMVNQQFRRDIFMRGVVPLTKQKMQALWRDTRFALTMPRDEVPLTIAGSLGESSLKAEIYNPILDAFSHGPRAVKQLIIDAKINAIGSEGLLQALSVLVATGRLSPCLSEKGDSKRAQRTKAFNKVVCGRAFGSNTLQALASPVIGGGIPMDRFSQMFLWCHSQKENDTAHYVWSALEAGGERLIKNGEPIADSEENLAEVRLRFSEFEKKHLPVYKQLGIA